jgi:hypothetical protein
MTGEANQSGSVDEGKTLPLYGRVNEFMTPEVRAGLSFPYTFSSSLACLVQQGGTMAQSGR